MASVIDISSSTFHETGTSSAKSALRDAFLEREEFLFRVMMIAIPHLFVSGLFASHGRRKVWTATSGLEIQGPTAVDQEAEIRLAKNQESRTFADPSASISSILLALFQKSKEFKREYGMLH